MKDLDLDKEDVYEAIRLGVKDAFSEALECRGPYKFVDIVLEEIREGVIRAFGQNPREVIEAIEKGTASAFYRD